MEIQIKKIREKEFKLYSNIPIRFKVHSIFRLENINSGLGGIKFIEEEVEKPYVKNYDSIENSLNDWKNEFDISNWGIFIAESDGIPVGGMTIAYDTPRVNMLDGRDDISVIWDIRVHPEYRGKRIGSK